MRNRGYTSRDLHWNGNRLEHGKRTVASIVPDAGWPGMWRVMLPDGGLSDMENRTRAKDVAMTLALAALQAQPGPLHECRFVRPLNGN